MQKTLAFLVLSTILFGSCYNYDGPTRPKIKRVIKTQKPYVIPVKKKPTSQEYLKTMAEDIAKTLPTSQVEVLTDSIKVFFPDNIQYGPSAVLPIDNISNEIKKLSGLIIKYDQTHILLTGHTDEGGDEQVNRRISELRSQYITDLISSYGVPKDRLSSWGLGSSAPIYPPDNKAKNRRVEFIVLSTIEDDEES